jgi:hypothetical protein
VDVVLLIGLFGLWLALALALALALGYWRRRGEARATPEVGSSLETAPDTDLEVRPVGDAVELWWPGGGRLATVRSVDVAGLGTPLRSPWARRAVATMLRRATKSMTKGAATRYRLTFPPDLMKSLSNGGSVDVVVGGGQLSTIGRGLGGAMGGPTLALAAGAVAMSVAQQQRLDRTLAVIEQRIDLVIDRMRDDDHGRLDAAEALLDQLDRRAAEAPSAQLRAELAAARHGVDGIYFARRRFGQRLGDAIGDAQDEAEADSGESQAWAAGVLEAVGDPGQLRSELFVYLRAVVVRARLATTTSGILAIDGDVDDANRLLAETVAELRSDFYGLYRRLRPLAEWAPKRALPWKRRDWDRAHETVVEVYELMAREVEPLLPPDEPEPVVLEALVDAAGELEDLSIVE